MGQTYSGWKLWIPAGLPEFFFRRKLKQLGYPAARQPTGSAHSTV